MYALDTGGDVLCDMLPPPAPPPAPPPGESREDGDNRDGTDESRWGDHRDGFGDHESLSTTEWNKGSEENAGEHAVHGHIR